MTDWKVSPLYMALVEFLPAFVTTTPGVDVSLNVTKFRTALVPERSHEAVYKWLRAGRLQPDNARHICDLANGDENVAALKAAGRTPPSIESFLPFFFAA